MPVRGYLKQHLTELVGRLVAPHVEDFSSTFRAKVVKVRNIENAAAFYGWSEVAKVNQADYAVEPGQLTQINERQYRDALLLANSAANAPTGDLIEIGTSHGKTTALLASLRPQSTVHSLDILPEQYNQGKHITHVLRTDRIGHVYRERGLTNVNQIFGDSMTWVPTLSNIGFAFIDGCHDYNYIINDTEKIITTLVPGAFICWHDFNPDLISIFPWLHQVCRAIDHLLQTNVLSGPVLYLEDSFTAIYRWDPR